MQDEFEVNVEDGSELAVAERIMILRKEAGEGNFAAVDELQRKWLESRGREEPVAGIIQAGKQDDDDKDEEEYDDELEYDDEDEDEEMGDAPELVSSSRERPPPEVDEDGFTKVVRRKNK
jgi:pre-rRNA-processing protein TSR2